MHFLGDKLASGVSPAVVVLGMMLLGSKRNRNWPSHPSCPQGCLVPDIAAGTLLEAGAWLQGGILERFHS